jgi:hypothetical protein
MVVAHLAAVVAHPAELLRQFIIIGEERPAIAIATQVLAGEEAGGTDVADGAALLDFMPS